MLSAARALLQSTSPRIHVVPIPPKGLGVVAAQACTIGTPLCVYPGVYTPTRPPIREGVVLRDGHVTPSGLDPRDNAYLLNLSVGGYLDGRALVGADGRKLDACPHSCAHLVNHAAAAANVEAHSFLWDHDEDDDNIPPWYFDPMAQSTVVYDGSLGRTAGAVFLATRDLDAGDELLLDYQLVPPLPDWASDWYDG